MAMIRNIFIYIFLNFIIVNCANALHTTNFIQDINKQAWDQANIEAKKLKSPNLTTLVTWLKLINDKNPDFYQLKAFIDSNPNWPDIKVLKQKIEENDFKNTKNNDVLNWFKNNPPETFIGKKRYLSLLDDGDLRKNYIQEIWQKANFTKEEQSKFLQEYSSEITKADHLKRIAYLIYNNKLDQAERILSLIPQNNRELYETSIAIQRGKTVKINQAYAKDIIILYSLSSYYNNEKDDEQLTKTLTYASNIKDENQLYFWKFKSKLIRNLIQEKHYYTAYLFASTHGNIDCKDYSEAEWLSGWIALQYLDKPKLAVTHFTNMLEKVKKPISISRANYWLARSYAKLNDSKNTQYWYALASKHYTTFYGQLAACKINECIVDVGDDPEITKEDYKYFKNNPLVDIALILHGSDYSKYVQKFIYKAIDDSKTLGEVALITRLGFELNHDHISVEAAKHASYNDMHVIHSNYPVLDSIYKEHELDPALIMALIRQESLFNKRAVSSAGALGLMQLMPHVAKETAKKINISYKKDKLTDDCHFNTMLGIHHLDKLLASYDNSYILTIAAYNAGDKPALQWIEKNGDPRNMTNIEKIVDWIESITYYETRNYVQRVLEGKSVYHLLINNEKKLPILDDLKNKS